MNPTRISELKTEIFDGVKKQVILWSKISLTIIQYNNNKCEFLARQIKSENSTKMGNFIILLSSILRVIIPVQYWDYNHNFTEN